VPGWRYVKAFLPQKDFAASTDHLSYYYVKTDELEKVYGEIFDRNRTFRADAQMGREIKEQWIRTAVRFTDYGLYRNGIYLSPDLYVAVFDWISWVLLALGLSAAAAVLAHQWSVHRRRSGSAGNAEPDDVK